MRHSSKLYCAALFALMAAASPVGAQQKYDPGVSDTEIKIGNTMPYSGPQSAFAALGKTLAAYFRMINDQGGINGRQINFISYDDSYSPPKTVEQTRRLVESDEVLLIFGALGTPQNLAVQKYLNGMRVPQLFVNAGATHFGDYRKFSWTMGWPASYQTEGRVFAKYILQNSLDAKIGVLLQNDDSGKDRLKGLRDGLGPKADKMIVSTAPHEIMDPTIDSQIVSMKASGADVVVSLTTPKATSQAIKKMAELGWTPTHLVSATSNAISSVLAPAGFENSQGIISATNMKDPDDPSLREDPGVKKWNAFMDKYYPEGDKKNNNTIRGYLQAQTLVEVLKRCGNDLSRKNIMREAANMKGVTLDMFSPGIAIDTSPTDYYPIEQVQLIRFEGNAWKSIGPLMSGEITTIGSPAER